MVTKAPLLVRLPPELKARAEGYAAALGISLNALVAIALEAKLRPPRTRSAPRTAPAEPVSAPQLPTARNAPCPCGSGKKAKRCCHP